MWERELELKHLVALQAVAAERSFGRAAERLGYTQSAISQQIAGLERVVGEPVFDRPGEPRPVELTPVGQVVLDHAEQVFRRLAQAEEEVARLKAGDGGRLVIGTFQSVSVKVLPDVIRVLKAERPQLDIRLFEADDHDTIVGRCWRAGSTSASWSARASTSGSSRSICSTTRPLDLAPQ